MSLSKTNIIPHILTILRVKGNIDIQTTFNHTWRFKSDNTANAVKCAHEQTVCVKLDVSNSQPSLDHPPPRVFLQWRKNIISWAKRPQWSVRKTRFSNGRNLKTPALCFSVDGKHFENGALRKRWRHDNHVISLTKFCSNTNPKWPVMVAFSISPARSARKTIDTFSGWKRRFQTSPA